MALMVVGGVVIVILAVLLWSRSLSVEGTALEAPPKLPFEFRFQPLDHPALDLLRRRENLDAVVAGSQDRFGKLVRLCNWTRQQWEPGDPKPYPPWNALAILDLIRTKKTGGFCAQYAQVFAQSCLAFGWQARYIESGPTTDPCAHYTAEIWVDPLGKWVLLDPFNDVWFERQGRPLSGLEVHRALVTGVEASIVVRGGPDGAVVQEPRRRTLIESFYYIRLHLRADHLSRPEGPFEWKDKVDWTDPQTVRWPHSTITNPAVPKGPTAPMLVKDSDIFDFAINRAIAEIQGNRLLGRAEVHLTQVMPSFRHYLVRVGDGERRVLEADRFEVPLEGNAIRVEIVPVNIRGAEGVPARLVIK